MLSCTGVCPILLLDRRYVSGGGRVPRVKEVEPERRDDEEDDPARYRQRSVTGNLGPRVFQTASGTPPLPPPSVVARFLIAGIHRLLRDLFPLVTSSRL